MLKELQSRVRDTHFFNVNYLLNTNYFLNVNHILECELLFRENFSVGLLFELKMFATYLSAI